MTFRQQLSDNAALQYVADSLEIMSPAGRRCLMETPWMTEVAQLNEAMDHVQTLLVRLHRPDCAPLINDLRHCFMQLHDVQGTISRLRSHTLLDEVELFELKAFCHLCMQARKLCAQLEVQPITALPDLADLFALLDPDSTGVPHFYIYDSYHPDLPSLRAHLRAAQADLERQEQSGDEAALDRALALVTQLLGQQEEVQLAVIRRLSDQLHPHADRLATALDRMGRADLLLAKAVLADRWQLARPTFSPSATRLRGLYLPHLRHHNEALHLRYQPVDLDIAPGVCLITGANMAGKTVLLKALACAQQMAQYGLYVPAAQATLLPVDEVALCIGDEQNEMNGLSSFASEIIKISTTLQACRHRRLLVLIDEPARTTNPIEGKAIVQAVIQLQNSLPSLTLITTHYSGLGTDCRRLRVRGFVEQLVDAPLTPATINRYMDYSLTPDTGDDVPREALRIAAILGCDEPLVSLATSLLPATV
ncbi:MAG: hypothetical protein IJV22_00020 [Bacteroidales bacterium]|nr:hypothetical protein [Bacteroidales bacterium]